jgi:hypothetical protein
VDGVPLPKNVSKELPAGQILPMVSCAWEVLGNTRVVFHALTSKTAEVAWCTTQIASGATVPVNRLDLVPLAESKLLLVLAVTWVHVLNV